MENQIVNYISKFVSLTEEETQALMEDIPVRTFPKGTLLIKEGDLLVESYFVLKGCLRQYFLTDGEEKTTFFLRRRTGSAFLESNAAGLFYQLFILCGRFYPGSLLS